MREMTNTALIFSYSMFEIFSIKLINANLKSRVDSLTSIELI